VVCAGIDVDNIADTQGERTQRGAQQGQRRVGQLAGVAVVAGGGGVIAAGICRDVYIEGGSGLWNRKVFGSEVRHLRLANQRDVNIQPKRSGAQAAVLRDPGELPVVGRGRRDVQQELAILVEVDLDRQLAGVV